MHRAEGDDTDAVGIMGPERRNHAVHIAVGTARPVEAIHAIGAREGWPVKTCRRGGAFGVIELWVEGCQLVEVLTEEMQADYLEAVTIENWQRMLLTLPQAEAQAA